ncbi:protein FAM177A1 isoform X2 [Aethina tumida]|uniref:protein FAM177A1 isoform X2 n=1 Tax=Aethina tumida TaxID=116153 RepID=UPI0021498454|nr:protein FAM177A1 isoform X2 [Aethina tumida]
MVLVDPDAVNNGGGANGTSSAVRVKQPKRILHFSDGVLEEYSTDEEEVDGLQKDQTVSTLSWGPWFWYKAWAAGTSTLTFLDATGEFLASVLGITTPRYYFELEEYKRREEQKEKRKEQEQGWSEPSNAVPLTGFTTKQPAPVAV